MSSLGNWIDMHHNSLLLTTPVNVMMGTIYGLQNGGSMATQMTILVYCIGKSAHYSSHVVNQLSVGYLISITPSPHALLTWYLGFTEQLTHSENNLGWLISFSVIRLLDMMNYIPGWNGTMFHNSQLLINCEVCVVCVLIVLGLIICLPHSPNNAMECNNILMRLHSVYLHL